MVKRRHISAFLRQNTARRVGFVVCLSVISAVSMTANAQTAAENPDKPLASASASVPVVQDALPLDLQPEKLSAPRAQEINPASAKRLRAASRNRWDPATLTQSTGLSAASFWTSPQPTASVETKAPLMPADILTAEELLNVGEIALPQIDPGLASPPREDGVINLGSPLRGALFDLPTTDNVNASVFKLDLGERLCFGTAEECKANETRHIDVGYAKNITHGKQGGLNLQLTPRAGIRFDDESQSALVGALVRIGDNLREGSEMKSNTWYFFAGADAEAVTYTPNSARRLTSGEFHLQNRIIVGDAQAGLGYRLGEADLALTYFKRQASAENYSYNEDAAALSITWKR